MSANPHLAGDMRRDLNQLQLLYDMNELSPQHFRALLKSLACMADEVERLTDAYGDEPYVTVTPQGLAALAGEMQRRFQMAASLPVDRVRLVGHLAVVDGGRA